MGGDDRARGREIYVFKYIIYMFGDVTVKPVILYNINVN